MYVANGIQGRSFWHVSEAIQSEVIQAADRLIRAERERKPKPILRPKPRPRKEDAL